MPNDKGIFKRALVTGITGYIGQHLAHRLIQDNWEVHGIIRPESDLKPLQEMLGENYHQIRLYLHKDSEEDLGRIIQTANPTVCFHLASFFRANHSSNDIGILIESNILFGMKLLEALTFVKGVQFINLGTAWQDFEGQEGRALNAYAATKQAFESIVTFYSDFYQIKVMTLKLFDIYGPGDRRPKVLNLICEAAMQKKTLNLSGGEQYLDLIYIDDLIDAICQGNELLSASESLLHRYSISSGKSIRLLDLVKKYEVTTQRKVLAHWGILPYRPREVFKPFSSGSTLPGWSPKISLEEGIRRIDSFCKAPNVEHTSMPLESVILSVVIPCWNESLSIENLIPRIRAVILDANIGRFEILIVDNGSSQEQHIELTAQCRYQEVRILRLSRNFGYQGALWAGLDHAKGKGIVFMDGDGEDPPEVISEFIAKWREGYQIIYGVRRSRKASQFAIFCYKAFYRILSKAAYINIPIDAGEFSLISGQAVTALRGFKDRVRMLRILRAWMGFQQVAVYYDRQSRIAGKSKFSFFAAFSFAWDGFVAITDIPVKFAIFCSMFSFCIGIVGTLYYLLWYFFGNTSIPGFASTNITILVLFSMLFLCIAILSKYIMTILEETRQRYPYIVAETKSASEAMPGPSPTLTNETLNENPYSKTP